MEIRTAIEKDLSKIMRLKEIEDQQLILSRMEKAQEGQVAYLIAEEGKK